MENDCIFLYSACPAGIRKLIFKRKLLSSFYLSVFATLFFLGTTCNAFANAAAITDPCSVTFTSITTTETCPNSNATITINGLVPNSVSSIGYTKSGIAQTPLSVTANASGVGTFTVFVTAPGQTVVLTSITRTDVVPGCSISPTGNNSVIFILNSGCTSVQASQCGINLPAIDSYVYANLVALAESYRWRVTTLTGSTASQIQYAYTVLRNLRITQLGTYAFDTQYKVEVATYRNGMWSPYGAVCNVRTPATTTQLTTCGGGGNLNAMADAVYANLVPFATGYKFRISDPFNPSIQEEQFRTTREFRMSLITGFTVQFNKLYNVEVSVRNTDGTYLPYGPLCTIKTPLFATTSIQDSQCDDYTVPDYTTLLYANSYPGVVYYAFKLTGPGLPYYGSVVLKPLRAFCLNDFPGIQLHAGEIYDVRVRLIFNINDAAGPYGKTCSFIAPALSDKTESAVKNIFGAVAYPNPYAENFMIDLKTSSVAKVILKTYDMTGRLLEMYDVSPAEIKQLQMGGQFPTGVYDIVVQQNDNIKSIKVVKR